MCDPHIPEARKLFPCAAGMTSFVRSRWDKLGTLCPLAALWVPQASVLARLRTLFAPPPSFNAIAGLRLVVSIHARFGGIHTDPSRARDSDVVRLLSCAAVVAQTWSRNVSAATQRPTLVTFVSASDQPSRLTGLVGAHAALYENRATCCSDGLLLLTFLLPPFAASTIWGPSSGSRRQLTTVKLSTISSRRLSRPHSAGAASCRRHFWQQN